MPSGHVTRLDLLRHGHVEGFARRLVRGQSDAPLSAHGIDQHGALVEWMVRRGERPALVISSDLSRCRELASRLAQAFDCPLILDAVWREQHMGEWQGRPWDEISERHGSLVNAYWDDYWNAAPPGGESMRDLRERIAPAWEALERAHRGEHLLLVTHAGVIRTLLCAELGVSPGEALRFAPPLASCTTLLLSEAGAVLEGLGRGPLNRPPASTSGPPRIALTGSAGTGKTTLGRALARELGLPFIEERMRLRLEAGLELHALSRGRLRALIEELWREQRELESEASSGYLVDRGSLDYAAFWLHYGFYEDQDRTRLFVEEMIEWSARYTQVLLLPHGAIPLEADGIRATNPWQQLHFQLLIEGLAERHLPPERLHRLPRSLDLPARLAWARARCGEAPR